MTLFTLSLFKRRTSAGTRTFTFMTLLCIILLGVNACSSSDADDDGKADGTPQPLTTTLPAQEPVTLPEEYPQKLVPPMEGTKILSSAFNKDQGSATLIFESTAEPKKIFDFYSDHFLSLGFVKIPDSGKLNDALKEFHRHDAKETANVAITKNSDGKPVTTVSVSGIRPEDFR